MNILGPQLGKIDAHEWLLLQRIAAGEVQTFAAEDILGLGYRVFEWGDGRHRKPTDIRLVFAEGTSHRQRAISGFVEDFTIFE